jgi:two-component system KDP operon response regulator KdpE
MVYDQRPDLVILDVRMPKMDGWETCRRIRELTDVPIIMLTALDEETDQIKGLEIGADDYIPKPYKMGVLLARVRALLRRVQYAPSPESEVEPVYNDGYLLIDLERRIVEVNGELLKLSAIEFRLLTILYQNAGRILETEQILSHVWGPQYEGEITYVRVYIYHLRQKIEPDPNEPTYIQTERQIGYRFTFAEQT